MYEILFEELSWRLVIFTDLFKFYYLPFIKLFSKYILFGISNCNSCFKESVYYLILRKPLYIKIAMSFHMLWHTETNPKTKH